MFGCQATPPRETLVEPESEGRERQLQRRVEELEAANAELAMRLERMESERPEMQNRKEREELQATGEARASGGKLSDTFVSQVLTDIAEKSAEFRSFAVSAANDGVPTADQHLKDLKSVSVQLDANISEWTKLVKETAKMAEKAARIDLRVCEGIAAIRNQHHSLLLDVGYQGQAEVEHTLKIVGRAKESRIKCAGDIGTELDRLSKSLEDEMARLASKECGQADSYPAVRSAGTRARELRSELLTKTGCDFFFVPAEALRQWKGGVLPRFQDLPNPKALGQDLVKLHVSLQDILSENELLARILVISHRWISREHPDSSREHPDSEGKQLDAIQSFLRDNSHLEYVWMDWWCLPQKADGISRTAEEKALFDRSLDHVNLLYLGAQVLILLDLQYVGRFWTSYEFWLSHQICTKDGLKPSSGERSVSIRTLGAAASSHIEAWAPGWRNLTVEQALRQLGEDDILVTNAKDKTEQLEVLGDLGRQIPFFFEVYREMQAQTGATAGKAAKLTNQDYHTKEHFQKELETNPANATAWNALGYYHGEGTVSGKVYSKGECFQKALEIDATIPVFWNNLGNCGGGTVGTATYSAQECKSKALETSAATAQRRDQSDELLRIFEKRRR